MQQTVLADPHTPLHNHADEALKDALARLRAVDERYKALLHDSVANIAAELPREQRIALLRTAMRRGAGDGPPDIGGPGRPPRGP